MLRMRRALVAMAVAGGFTVLPGAAPALAAGDNCAQAGQVTDAEAPWSRRMLDPDSVWPLTTGGGSVVAVLATGVDAAQPQLKGRVAVGYDAVARRTGGTADCTGTGTQIAGVIAAQPSDGNGVVGLAPDATILPVRVVPDTNSSGVRAQPAPLARGITWAAEHRADVIVVAEPLHKDDQAVRAAVADAIFRGVVVVAAAGDLGAAKDGNPASYPASYPDVLGVGALTSAGQTAESSQYGSYVDLVAPGEQVPTVQRGSGLVAAGGTAVAAGFVGGAAALVRSKRGDLVGKDIARALVASASAAPLGPGFGAGVVNPYAAVADTMVKAGARPLPAVAGLARRSDRSAGRRRNIALAGAGLAALAVLAALLLTAAVRRGRRQRWHPGLAATLPPRDEPLEPGPPVMLLQDSTEPR